MQAALDPFYGAKRLENGALFYEVEDRELSPDLNNEERLRIQFEKLKSNFDAPLEIDEENEEELRLVML